MHYFHSYLNLCARKSRFWSAAFVIVITIILWVKTEPHAYPPKFWFSFFLWSVTFLFSFLSVFSVECAHLYSVSFLCSLWSVHVLFSCHSVFSVECEHFIQFPFCVFCGDCTFSFSFLSVFYVERAYFIQFPIYVFCGACTFSFSFLSVFSVECAHFHSVSFLCFLWSGYIFN